MEVDIHDTPPQKKKKSIVLNQRTLLSHTSDCRNTFPSYSSLLDVFMSFFDIVYDGE